MRACAGGRGAGPTSLGSRTRVPGASLCSEQMPGLQTRRAGLSGEADPGSGPSPSSDLSQGLGLLFLTLLSLFLHLDVGITPHLGWLMRTELVPVRARHSHSQRVLPRGCPCCHRRCPPGARTTTFPSSLSPVGPSLRPPLSWPLSPPPPSRTEPAMMGFLTPGRRDGCAPGPVSLELFSTLHQSSREENGGCRRRVCHGASQP